MEHVNRYDKSEALDMGVSLESFIRLAVRMMRQHARRVLYG